LEKVAGESRVCRSRRFGSLTTSAAEDATFRSAVVERSATEQEPAAVISENDLARLKQLAQDVSGDAYCPYSGFRVGAVVVTDSGEEFAGCNVENASYGLSICAERNAVFQMIAKGRQRIKWIVIYTPTEQPAAPCGACRQVINEFGPLARVVSLCDGNQRIDASINDLLPDSFGPHNLDDS
jgi:cytidine deaminase